MVLFVTDFTVLLFPVNGWRRVVDSLNIWYPYLRCSNFVVWFIIKNRRWDWRGLCHARRFLGNYSFISSNVLSQWEICHGYIPYSWGAILVLRRDLEPLDLPPTSLLSDSSGGSDSGLDVVVNGLPGGLVLSAEATVVLNRDNLVEVCMLVCVFRWASRANIAGEFRARSQKCSKGRITRM